MASIRGPEHISSIYASMFIETREKWNTPFLPITGIPQAFQFLDN
jgi:hypothetical protein